MNDCEGKVISFRQPEAEFSELDEEDIEDVTDLSDGNMVSESALADADANNAAVEGSPVEDTLSRFTEEELEDAVRDIMVRLLDK